VDCSIVAREDYNVSSMRLFSALTVAIMFAIFAPVKADELVTYGKVVRAYAAVSCLALEGIPSIDEAVKTLF
jgi:hypothetical protein